MSRGNLVDCPKCKKRHYQGSGAWKQCNDGGKGKNGLSPAAMTQPDVTSSYFDSGFSSYGGGWDTDYDDDWDYEDNTVTDYPDSSGLSDIPEGKGVNYSIVGWGEDDFNQMMFSPNYDSVCVDKADFSVDNLGDNNYLLSGEVVINLSYDEVLARFPNTYVDNDGWLSRDACKAIEKSLQEEYAEVGKHMRFSVTPTDVEKNFDLDVIQPNRWGKNDFYHDDNEEVVQAKIQQATDQYYESDGFVDPVLGGRQYFTVSASEVVEDTGKTFADIMDESNTGAWTQAMLGSGASDFRLLK